MSNKEISLKIKKVSEGVCRKGFNDVIAKAEDVLGAHERENILAFSLEYSMDFLELNEKLSKEDEKSFLEELEKNLEVRVSAAIEDLLENQRIEALYPNAFVKKGFKQIYISAESMLFAKANGEVIKYGYGDSVVKMNLQGSSSIRKAIDNFSMGLPVGKDIKFAMGTSKNLENVIKRTGFDMLTASTNKIGQGMTLDGATGYKVLETSSAAEGLTSALSFITVDVFVGQDVPATVSTYIVTFEEAQAIRKAFNNSEETFKGDK